ncbi:MAG: tRNA 2-thiouridine(34) synthase MnmA [Fibrobacterota bacterium]|nr:tRNA 2-thiouridine(34) synthase MnmA [Fibrobacterota bacterium]QQS03784.1 MAG: tRNA 2-thiouridine(34) synthase MnmA [Fibrobacterota bacterium]
MTDQTNQLEAVAMSGGVDSSVAALLRVRDGARIVGLTMKLWDSECDGPSADRACCTADHASDARRVCQKLSSPHYTLDLRQDFRRDVVDVFVSEYLSGRTPNPCVRCNTYLKWDALWNRARELGCSSLVTGHYARIQDTPDGPGLFRAADLAKDQSYFLWGIPRPLLARTRFPLSDLAKPEIRRLAEEAGLPTAAKRESQDICFVPGGDYRTLVRASRPHDPLLSPGPILGPGGRQLGNHEGLAGYTIGQRRGVKAAWTEPLYVTEIDVAANILRLGTREELLVDRLEVGEINLLSRIPVEEPVGIQVRYRSEPTPGRVAVTGGEMSISLPTPILAPAAGQSIVLYDGPRLIGGGVLKNAFRTNRRMEAP